MALPQFSMRELIEAGVHFGHKTRRWNPRMAPYLYGIRNDIHIIDLGKTVPMLQRALEAIRDVTANNGRILFVGTKRQAEDPIAEAAKRCGQFYINQRWLGGLLTNWNTIQVSIKTLRKLEELQKNPPPGLTKKELLSQQRQLEKLDKSLGGIKDMGGLPDLMFIIDTNLEDLAVQEAKKLGIPIVAVIDSNCSCEGITYPVPGNDDSSRAIRLYCRLVSDAVLEGIQQGLTSSGVDMGASEDPKEMQQSESAAPAGEPKPEEGKDDEESGKRKGNRVGRNKPADRKTPMVTVKKTPPGKKKSA
jgi:small subunit ribosomal protein S2